jgi:SAM-dependent methyltransferase
MPTESEVKQQVREFYNQVGWQEVDEGLYQNARYEDLRPVSHEYIHKCHLRINRHIQPEGRFFLDAGSGPIQYPEYLEYSNGYDYRVCADISIVALQEARKRIGEHGLFVVVDIANLPFAPEVFDGVVSLHTIHHLPVDEHLQAYEELYRVLSPERTAVAVNGWRSPPITRFLNTPKRWSKKFKRYLAGARARILGTKREKKPKQPKGTYVQKYNADWLKSKLEERMPVEILVWRGIDSSILRTYIHEKLGGRWILKIVYRWEERAPHFWGQYGRYPLILMRKPKHEKSN